MVFDILSRWRERGFDFHEEKISISERVTNKPLDSGGG
jgi:hypothetical protein